MWYIHARNRSAFWCNLHIIVSFSTSVWTVKLFGGMLKIFLVVFNGLVYCIYYMLKPGLREGLNWLSGILHIFPLWTRKICSKFIMETCKIYHGRTSATSNEYWMKMLNLANLFMLDSDSFLLAPTGISSVLQNVGDLVVLQHSSSLLS